MNYARPNPYDVPGLLDQDDVLPALAAWAARGQRVALVTLIAIEGGSPRPIGAQMAVCEDGSYAGYLSGGCLEQAVALEAQALIAQGTNRLVRYGRGSPYFDIKLPCGSGLDIYFDTSLSPGVIARMGSLRRARTPFALVTDVAEGSSRLLMDRAEVEAGSARRGDFFTRSYVPAPRMVLFGAGPTVSALSRVAATAGIETAVWAGDDATRGALDACGIGHFATPAAPAELLNSLDAFSAVVLAFHEHAQEPAILDKVLASQAFYIGVLGNHAVHRERLARLADAGHAPQALQRIRAPIGLIPQAKGQASLALGILAEIMIEAKARKLVS